MAAPRLEQRLACRERPSRHAVMSQVWMDLLFAHWKMPPEAIQRTLPPGLTVDTWNGRAYLGVVPFWMRRIHPVAVPSLPWISNFLELNVRTYVYDARGNPGVWFYSLDCSQPLAVWLARAQFGLPYFHARMSATKADGGEIRYRSRRWRSIVAGEFSYRFGPPQDAALPGSLEFFLVERYLLFAAHRGRLLRGQVHHAPYPLAGIEMPSVVLENLLPPGLDYPDEPTHLLGSAGVEVEVFSPEWID